MKKMTKDGDNIILGPEKRFCSHSQQVLEFEFSRQKYLSNIWIFTHKIGTPARYTWVNADKTEDERTGTKAEEHQKELFMCGKTDMVAIGGG